MPGSIPWPPWTARNVPVILRLPVIPGITDTGAFARAAALVKSNPNVLKAEIMPYHAIGADKWAELGLRYALPDLPTVPPEQAAQWQRILTTCCADPEKTRK